MRKLILKLRLRRPRQAALGALLGLACLGTSLAADSGAGAQPPADHPTAAPKKKTPTVPSEKQIDINSASREQLKTLPGIGDAEARKIIAGRPYVSKGELVTKNVLPEGLYISIRYRIKSVPVDKKQSKK